MKKQMFTALLLAGSLLTACAEKEPETTLAVTCNWKSTPVYTWDSTVSTELKHGDGENEPFSGDETNEAHITLADYPNYEFIRRYTGSGDSMLVLRDGTEKRIFGGMPIEHTFFTDLSGDGLPELCADMYRGSGMIDRYIAVYDPAADKTYTLEARGRADFSLVLENDGSLIAEQRPAENPIGSSNSGILKTRGKLMLKNGRLFLDNGLNSGSGSTMLGNKKS